MLRVAHMPTCVLAMFAAHSFAGAGAALVARPAPISHAPCVPLPCRWDDSWGPELDHSSSNDTELPDPEDTAPEQDAAAAGTSSVVFAASSSAPGSSSCLRSPSGSAPVLQHAASSGCSSASAAAAAAAVADGADGDAGAGGELDAAAQNARLRSKQDACPNTCVYVGFLGWWVTERDLVEYFSPYGELVSVRVSGAARHAACVARLAAAAACCAGCRPAATPVRTC